jgi:hypothetical protein
MYIDIVINVCKFIFLVVYCFLCTRFRSNEFY